MLLALWLVAAGAEYRTVFVLGGIAALGAVVPILRLEGAASPALVRAVGWRAARFAGWTALLLALAQFIHRTPLLEADKAGFEALHGLGATPEIVEKLLVEPSLRNYVIIVILASLIGARLWGRTTPGRTLLLVAGSGIVAYAAVRTCWALWERPRPEEVLDIDPINGHSWAAYPSFPSGHVAVTTALALATGALIPKLRYVMWTYAVVIAFTRLAYGAHFPSDVILGFVLGYLAVRTTITPLPGASHDHRGGSGVVVAVDGQSVHHEHVEDEDGGRPERIRGEREHRVDRAEPGENQADDLARPARRSDEPRGEQLERSDDEVEHAPEGKVAE